MSIPWTPPTNPSQNLRIALAYISALEQWDEKKLMDTLDETVEHRILPVSMTRPQLFKYQYLEYFRGLRRMFRKPLQRTIHEVVELGDHIVIHMSREGESATGHYYKNEYMILLEMMASSTGGSSRKIRSVKEFVDSKASASFFRPENKRMHAAATQEAASPWSKR